MEEEGAAGGTCGWSRAVARRAEYILQVLGWGPSSFLEAGPRRSAGLELSDGNTFCKPDSLCLGTTS